MASSSHHLGNLNGSELGETHQMVTGVQEEVTYCSPGTSSGKQKKARSTSQSQFLSKSTSATIEADQIVLALQQLATKSNSANLNNNINSISFVAQTPENDNGHLRWEIREIQIVWRSVPNKFETSQSLDGGRQNKLLPLCHAWWCAANIQKHHQP